MTQSSKFSRPGRQQPTQADIDRVIGAAEARDDPAPVVPPSPPLPEVEVRFTMVLPAEMSERVDKARKGAGGMARLAWIRLAIAEKLSRDGM